MKINTVLELFESTLIQRFIIASVFEYIPQFLAVDYDSGGYMWSSNRKDAKEFSYSPDVMSYVNRHTLEPDRLLYVLTVNEKLIAVKDVSAEEAKIDEQIELLKRKKAAL